jgi:hypothetical protein
MMVFVLVCGFLIGVDLLAIFTVGFVFYKMAEKKRDKVHSRPLISAKE